MNENYLHFLWKSKRLPFHLLKTTNNQTIEIRHVGFHNSNESGPDFSNGRIILDGLEWCGNIELHIKSSDWYVHKHQNDLAYNNVILHVVYEHDCEVHIQGASIPTIELKSHIDWPHFDSFNKFITNKGEINCSKSLSSINSIYIESMIERALIDRLNRKSYYFNSEIEVVDPKEYLYFLTAKAFGAKVNTLPFEELAIRLPLAKIKKRNTKDQMRLILEVSGVDEFQALSIASNNSIASNKVEHFAWKRKGLRPPSFPEIKVKQFALLVSEFDFEMIHFLKNANDLYKFISELFNSISLANDKKYKFSTNTIDLFVINCIVPFLWWLGETKFNNGIKEKALDLLKLIKSEKNYIIDEWRRYGLLSNSAYTSQALIELYNEHCTYNKCLSCEIGVNVLKQ